MFRKKKKKVYMQRNGELLEAHTVNLIKDYIKGSQVQFMIGLFQLIFNENYDLKIHIFTSCLCNSFCFDSVIGFKIDNYYNLHFLQ